MHVPEVISITAQGDDHYSNSSIVFIRLERDRRIIFLPVQLMFLKSYRS